MVHRRSSTFTQPTDVYDVALRKEREELALPFSKSPFAQEGEPGGNEDEKLEPGEIRVKVANELPWSDLLLEIAMTTTFASLTDGTPILLPTNALSYICFFILVWWIWASQVCYNMRYRQADWLHRIYVFLQLVIFSSLAAFTRNFDITNGIAKNSDEDATQQSLSDLGSDQSDLAALSFREHRLPKLNARGVSMAMVTSRLLLLVQYLVVFHHSRRLKLKRTALLIHISSLVFSILCYLATFLLIGGGDDEVSKTREIVKTVLWYLPVAVEIAAHFVANKLPGHVRYSNEGIIARSGTLFVIILGGGLDKITSGFQDIVGNTGLGASGSGLFLSAAVILIISFLLYFGSTGSSRELGSQRALTWFFCHIFYLAALIITLQGVATTLSFMNLFHAINTQSDITLEALAFVNNTPGVNITAAALPNVNDTLAKMGLSLGTYIEVLNAGITEGVQINDTSVAVNTILQLEMDIIYNTLQVFEAQPEDNSLLWAQLNDFTSADPANSTIVNADQYADLFTGIIRARGSSVLWFYGAAGSTLLGLVLLTLIRGMPRDKWEWGSVISRLIVGITVACLSLLSLGSSKPLLDPNNDFAETKSKIWRLADDNWVLPVFAIMIAALQVVEWVLVFFAYRAYPKVEQPAGLPSHLEKLDQSVSLVSSPGTTPRKERDPS